MRWFKFHADLIRSVWRAAMTAIVKFPYNATPTASLTFSKDPMMMPNAANKNTTSRRDFLSTLAVAVPTVVAGAPMAAAALADQPARAKEGTSPTEAIEQFANMLLMVNVATVAEDDQHVVFSVRVPRQALRPDPYTAGLADEKFGADVAAYLAARIREL
jgi:hypothetical protein